jgi:hypothetical protein
MPVEFLSDEQFGAYGRFTGELSAAERFFYLDDADRNLIARRRSDHHRRGSRTCYRSRTGRGLQDGRPRGPGAA